ncbi:MAG TPA: ROK family protein [Candidatus Limnocylindrales bacterium]|nr:ROK family protein [Candidatus Limnocylindrales bacterium]
MRDTDRTPSTDAVLALDLGASRIRVATVAGDGKVVSRMDARTPLEAGPQGVVASSIGMLRRVRDASPVGVRESIVGVGISAPGPLDPARGVLVEPPNMGHSFRGADLAGPIGTALGLPTVVERDTHVAALAEWMFGAARGLTDFLYLTVSTGIGGAIVAGGRLIGGPDGVAGELGHVLVDIDGPPCGCGGTGHLEAIASGVAIARAASAAVANGTAPGLASLASERGRGLDARDVAEAEADGDPDAAAIMERARRAFADSCVSLVDVFNPDRIVIGGSIARNQGEGWLGPARERVAAVAFSIPRRRVEIVGAALGDDVGLIGAVALLRRASAGLV